MEEFTKGPWKAFGMEIRFPEKLSGEYVNPVASVSRMNRAKHDAALIAAAPEMYEMLSELSGQLTDINAHAHVRRIERLLAKARGES